MLSAKVAGRYVTLKSGTRQASQQFAQFLFMLNNKLLTRYVLTMPVENPQGLAERRR